MLCFYSLREIRAEFGPNDSPYTQRSCVPRLQGNPKGMMDRLEADLEPWATPAGAPRYWGPDGSYLSLSFSPRAKQPPLDFDPHADPQDSDTD